MASSPGVLVIDDEEIVREAFEALLGAEGYRVRTAESGQQGLDLLADGRFDAVLLDLMLPDRNGLEVLEDIRRIDDELPVVMVTAKSTIENAIAATRRGAFHFIAKPFQNDEVLITVDNAL